MRSEAEHGASLNTILAKNNAAHSEGHWRQTILLKHLRMTAMLSRSTCLVARLPSVKRHSASILQPHRPQGPLVFEPKDVYHAVRRCP